MHLFKNTGPSPAVIAVALSLSLNLSAQAPVPVGAGSIASAPPAYKAKTAPDGPGFNATAILSRKIFADELPASNDGSLDIPGRPIPTNDWWTDIINNQFSGALWSYPAMLRTSEDGVEINYPSYWADAGKEMKSRSRISVGATRFRAAATIASDWHDWDVIFRMPSAADDAAAITVTSAHGSPFTWFEYKDLDPELTFSASPELFGLGKGLLGLKIGSDIYGLYYPAAVSPALSPDGALTFDGPVGWLVVALLRSESDLAAFAPYAVSVPRSTRVEWNYDEPSARVTSSWTVTAENLRDKSASAPVLQGFLPHAYKYALPGASLGFIDDKGFLTPRGEMKLAASDAGTFSYTCQFSGMLPTYAAPTTSADPSFRTEVLDKLMADYAAKGSFGADTYWGGKGLLQMAMNMSFAKEAGNKTLYEDSRRRLREAFENWLTYTPGEDSFFFSYYPRWGAMLGFDVSYDSDAFNDHHFHYGYFTYAAALLCMEDANFAERYGELLTMIAKDYANWDRADSRFPFMRTLDPWCGHSWAGGLGDHGNDNGNGQESTSEAMQSWGGLYLLGVALGNREMRDAGIWGWSTEARATREYWYDVDAPRPANAGGRKPWLGKGDRKGNYNYEEYPYAYNSNITGKGIGWWTWFGGDPLFMHSIQWMPVSPALDYLSWDTDFVAWAYDDMMSGANSSFSHNWFEPTVNSDNGETIEPLASNDWGNVTLAYLQRYDPAAAAEIFDTALERGMHIATAVSTAHISYYIAHSHLTYGDPDFSIHADIPTAQVRVRDGVRTFIVYNPDDRDRTVRFFDASGACIKTVTAPASRLAAICADPVASAIEYDIEGGAIIPPGEAVAVSARVLDQYGAGLPGASLSLALSDAAPAEIVGGTLKLHANAPKGSTFELILSADDIEQRVLITVNDRPVPASSRIEGLPQLFERSTSLSPELVMVDQYATESSPADAVWTCTPVSGGDALSLSVPFTFPKAGKYIVTASSPSTGASASAEVFAAPALPLLSLGAKALASSAENVGSLPEGACDGNNDVRWGSMHTDDEWLVLDLGEDCDISRVSILWEAAYAARYLLELAPDGAPVVSRNVVYAGQSKTISVPAESSWITVADERLSAPGEKTSVMNARGRYVRMRGLERGSAYGYSLYEMSVYGLSGSVADDAVIGLDFGLPEVMDSGAILTLEPLGFTRTGNPVSDLDVAWTADKDARFDGNDFTPLSHGMYTLTAALPGGAESSASIFVNELERPASVAFDSDSFTIIEGQPLRIPFTVMNQFLAPYTGPTDALVVTILDSDGQPTEAASYDVATMTFHSGLCAVYTLDFGGLAQCTVAVRPLAEVNLALGKPASASSANGDNKAALAVDGNVSSRWESQWDDNQYLSIDLEDTYLIDRVNIVWEGAFARSYRLQASIDGE